MALGYLMNLTLDYGGPGTIIIDRHISKRTRRAGVVILHRVVGDDGNATSQVRYAVPTEKSWKAFDELIDAVRFVVAVDERERERQAECRRNLKARKLARAQG